MLFWIIVTFLVAVCLTVVATLSFSKKHSSGLAGGITYGIFAIMFFISSYIFASLGAIDNGYPAPIDYAEEQLIYRVVGLFPDGNSFCIAAVPATPKGSDKVQVFKVQDTLPSWANSFYYIDKGSGGKVIPVSVQYNASAGN